MANILITLLMLAAAGVVMMRCLCVAAHLSPARWFDHKFKLLGLSISYAFIGGGAVSFALGWMPGAYMLLFGLAGLILFDRRLP